MATPSTGITLPPVSGAILRSSVRSGGAADCHRFRRLRVIGRPPAGAGLRPGEAAPLRWRHYQTDMAPLGQLLIANSNRRTRTKIGAVRHVPVHLTLAAMLADWKLVGWPALMGRTPEPNDLLIPSPAARRVVLGTMRTKNTWGHQTRRDLAAIGARHRRGYDLRRTFISLARSDGARADLLKLVTHGPITSAT